MDSGERIPKASGILMNRLKAVMSGDAELYFRFFDSKLGKEFHCSDAEEAKGAMQELKNFSGGSTAIQKCVEEAHKRIEELIKEGANYRPELVVITDGDDSFNLKPAAVAGTKVHAFVVEAKNEALVSFAKATGGVGFNNF